MAGLWVALQPLSTVNQRVSREIPSLPPRLIVTSTRPIRPMRQRPRPDRRGTRPWPRGKKPTSAAGEAHRDDADRVLLFGLHAVEAALANPKRELVKLIATENAAHRLAPLIAKRQVTVEPASPRDLDWLLGPDTVHQGVALEAEHLEPVSLDEIDANGILIVLDQVTDPHNVGAVLRSAAAFGSSGLVLTERHSPPLSGALAKVASGALDLVPLILVKNLAQSLAELGERNVLRVGLAEKGASTFEALTLAKPLALVLGAEGKGLRQLTREHCDELARISTRTSLASLNVSNAAAIALHWASVNAKG
jgi:23S rRNA (guanosine2251-2'-O)-methyltransferase